MASIEDRIRNQYTELTPQERKLADFILSRPEDITMLNTTDLANLCEVSKATISRMFKRLGYASFKEGQMDARMRRQLGTPIVDESLAPLAYEPHFEREIENLKILRSALPEPKMKSLIDRLAEAPRIKIIGFRNSYPLALHLRLQMIQVRSRVELAPLPGQTIGEEIEGLTTNDVVIFIAFRRRPKAFNEILNHLLAQNIPVLLVADKSLKRWESKVNWWVECPLESVSGFQSYSAPMSFATLLCNALLTRLSESGQSRILSISDSYRQMEELDFT